MDPALVQTISDAISPQADWQGEPLLPLKGGTDISRVPVEDLLSPHSYSPRGFFSVEEAACAFRVPWPVKFDPHGLPISFFGALCPMPTC